MDTKRITLILAHITSNVRDIPFFPRDHQIKYEFRVKGGFPSLMFSC